MPRYARRRRTALALLPLLAAVALAACATTAPRVATRGLYVDPPAKCRLVPSDAEGSLACRFDITATSDRRIEIGTRNRVATAAERQGSAAEGAEFWEGVLTAKLRRLAREVGTPRSERYVVVPAAERGATACVRAELAYALPASSMGGTLHGDNFNMRCVHHDPATGEVVEADVEYAEGRLNDPTPSPGFARDARAFLDTARLVATPGRPAAERP